MADKGGLACTHLLLESAWLSKLQPDEALSSSMPMQVYLAVPTNCPEGPNGERKKLSAAQQVSSTVGMYVSDKQGANFREVRAVACHHVLALLGRPALPFVMTSSIKGAVVRLLGGHGVRVCIHHYRDDSLQEE